jgi:hypothetical protein
MSNLIGDKGKSANEIISSNLRNNKVFALSRIGLSEVRWIDWFLRGGTRSNCDGYLYCSGFYAPTLSDRIEHCGVYGNCPDYFFDEYIKGIACADLQVFWFNYDGQKLVYDEQIRIFSEYSKNSLKIDCEALAPYTHENFWSKSLENKKVLVVYPFTKTIESQYLKKDLIWQGTHSGKLPNFDIITYKPVWSMDAKPHSSWKDSLEVMKHDISKIDFDVAILGCSHYGLPLVAHIKNNMNKSAIYMGGELQILFGIKGSRWDQWERVTKHYNENWTRSIDDIPVSHNSTLVDSGCYW